MSSRSTDLRCVVLPTPLLRRLKNDVDAFGEMVDRLYIERTLDVHLARVDLFAGLPDDVRQAIRESAELCSFSRTSGSRRRASRATPFTWCAADT